MLHGLPHFWKAPPLWDVPKIVRLGAIRLGRVRLAVALAEQDLAADERGGFVRERLNCDGAPFAAGDFHAEPISAAIDLRRAPRQPPGARTPIALRLPDNLALN